MRSYVVRATGVGTFFEIGVRSGPAERVKPARVASVRLVVRASVTVGVHPMIVCTHVWHRDVGAREARGHTALSHCVCTERLVEPVGVRSLKIVGDMGPSQYAPVGGLALFVEFDPVRGDCGEERRGSIRGPPRARILLQ